MSGTCRWKPEHPLQLSWTIRRLTRWGGDPVNVALRGSIYRTAAGGAPYRVRQLETGEVEVAAAGDLEEAVSETRFRLGEGLPQEPLRAVAERVPAVAEQRRRRPGFRPPLNPAVTDSLVSSICAQQINLSWAATLRRRLVERYGKPVEWEGVRVWIFPRPEALAEAPAEELRAMQFSARKAEYIIGTGRAVASGVLDGLEADDNRRATERITALRGLGRWTADWFLARCLARPDVIPAGDLGVRKAVSRLVADSEELLTEEEVRTATADWGDGTNLAVHLLLEALSDPD